MRDVLKNLIDGLSKAWVKVGKYWRLRCKSAKQPEAGASLKLSPANLFKRESL